MTLTSLNKRYIKPVLMISLLALLALTTIGCEEFGFPPLESPASEEEARVEAPPTTIGTNDRAILTVQIHLFSQAESYKAKAYLADFYAARDSWNAESTVFKDGTSAWYVETTGSGVAAERPYWQQASWLVFQDGTVMPSDRLQANALRIEADLQELSLQPTVIQGENNGE